MEALSAMCPLTVRARHLCELIMAKKKSDATSEKAEKSWAVAVRGKHS